MNGLAELQCTWESLARTDPFWSICTDPARKKGKWNRDEFFSTGRLEFDTVLALLSELRIEVDRGEAALDFGCGVGRLTRAMSGYFAECWGVDISPTMIRLAQELNSELENCRFVLNEKSELEDFGSDRFSFIYSSIVLQHIPVHYSTRYLQQLVRLLKPGGIFVFQLLDEFRGPAFVRVRQKLALRRRLQKLIAHKHGESGMELHCLREARVRDLLTAAQAKVIDVQYTNSADPAFNGRLQYSDMAPVAGYVSKQYVAMKKQ